MMVLYMVKYNFKIQGVQNYYIIRYDVWFCTRYNTVLYKIILKYRILTTLQIHNLQLFFKF